MNENHERHLISTFRHVDNLLSEAEHIIATAGVASPFREYTQDYTPAQRKVIHDYLLRVREIMRRIMTDLKITRTVPTCGALWAARGHLAFASIAVAELEPKRMRGYGELSDTDKKALDGIVTELSSELDRLNVYLDKGSASDVGVAVWPLRGKACGGGCRVILFRFDFHGFIRPTSQIFMVLRNKSPKAFPNFSLD